MHFLNCYCVNIFIYLLVSLSGVHFLAAHDIRYKHGIRNNSSLLHLITQISTFCPVLSRGKASLMTGILQLWIPKCWHCWRLPPYPHHKLLLFPNSKMSRIRKRSLRSLILEKSTLQKNVTAERSPTMSEDLHTLTAQRPAVQMTALFLLDFIKTSFKKII